MAHHPPMAEAAERWFVHEQASRLQLMRRSLGAWKDIPSTVEPWVVAFRDGSGRRLARLWDNGSHV
jgi:hypothetical protein